LKSDYIRLGAAGLLLGHGEVARWQPTGIERITKGNCPALVEVVTAVGADARPVVNRHGKALSLSEVPFRPRRLRPRGSPQRPAWPTPTSIPCGQRSRASKPSKSRAGRGSCRPCRTGKLLA